MMGWLFKLQYIGVIKQGEHKGFNIHGIIKASDGMKEHPRYTAKANSFTNIDCIVIYFLCEHWCLWETILFLSNNTIK